MRERQKANRRGAEREGNTESETGSRLSCQHRAWCGAQTHESWDHDLSQSRMLNQLSHLGAPRFLKYCTYPLAYIFLHRKHITDFCDFYRNWIQLSLLFCNLPIFHSADDFEICHLDVAKFGWLFFLPLSFFLMFVYFWWGEWERERDRETERETERELAHVHTQEQGRSREGDRRSEAGSSLTAEMSPPKPPPLSVLGNYQSTFCFHRFAYSEHFV